MGRTAAAGIGSLGRALARPAGCCLSLPSLLPQEVIRELAARARAAERLLRIQRAAEMAKKKPPVRVRALVQPTFVRFVFEMPDGINVSSVLNEQKLTLQFNSVLTFDL